MSLRFGINKPEYYINKIYDFTYIIIITKLMIFDNKWEILKEFTGAGHDVILNSPQSRWELFPKNLFTTN